MKLFGIDININRNNKPKFVKEPNCTRDMNGLKVSLEQRIDSTKELINQRCDDLRDVILKNGR